MATLWNKTNPVSHAVDTIMVASVNDSKTISFHEPFCNWFHANVNGL